jgi:AcrR family transcriptional regulator
MNRITKDPEERKQEIIDTAQALFLEKGYEQTSVSDIVKAIGVAQGTFYYYFESKDDVLEAITIEMVEELRERVLVIAEDKTLDPIEKWKRAITASSDYKITRRKELFEILQASKVLENHRMRERYRKLSRERVSQLFVDIINEGITEGVFHTDFPEETARIAITIGKSVSDDLKDILLRPDAYDDPAAAARQKFRAVQAAMERVLAAPEGSLTIISDEMLQDWFSKES